MILKSCLPKARGTLLPGTVAGRAGASFCIGQEALSLTSCSIMNAAVLMFYWEYDSVKKYVNTCTSSW